MSGGASLSAYVAQSPAASYTNTNVGEVDSYCYSNFQRNSYADTDRNRQTERNTDVYTDQYAFTDSHANKGSSSRDPGYHSAPGAERRETHSVAHPACA